MPVQRKAMSNPPTIAELEEFYYRLSAAYASAYADNADDITQSAIKLRRAFTLDGQTEESLLRKVKLLRQKTGDYKSKMSVQITDRFWSKQLTTPIRPAFYEPDKPVL